MDLSGIKNYYFGNGKADGNSKMKEILGGKGANLGEMSTLGVPVPPGFTIPCEASIKYAVCQAKGEHSSDFQEFAATIADCISKGSEFLTESFGYMPLVSVRSGARVSMPGMMDTILNVGLCSSTLDAWKERIGARAALDSYRRLIQMFSSVALDVPMEYFEEALHDLKAEVDAELDSDLTEDQLSRLVKRYLLIVEEHHGAFPDTIEQQIAQAVKAVFRSWDNERAQEYRQIHNIPEDWGTAVTIQSMVFGNMDDTSATGVLFTRDPSTGQFQITGEYLVNAQGEDVVAGIRTPEPLPKMKDWNADAYSALFHQVKMLEAHYGDMQDVEFTVQQGQLFILQTRNGKRSAMAEFKIAHDMHEQGFITKEQAFARIKPEQLIAVLQDTIDPKFKVPPHLTGIAAGGGVVSGVVVFSSEDAINCTEKCVLVTKETDPDDIGGMNASVGILTAMGGQTSHAAVVARGMNKACVVGATELQINSQKTMALCPGMKGFKKGDKITIDGSTGYVWVGIDVPLIEGGAGPVIKTVLSWGAKSTTSRLEVQPVMGYDGFKKEIASHPEKVLYVDTAALSLTTHLMSEMATLGLAIEDASHAQFIVDLGGMDSCWSRGDSAFYKMFGVPTTNYVHTMEVKAATMVSWPEKARERTTVVISPGAIPANSLALTAIKESLKTAGFKLQTNVETFADLMNASAGAQVSDAVIKSVFGTKKAYQTAVSLLKKAGMMKGEEAAPAPRYWYEAVL